LRILVLLTDAFGSRGGIAAYNRDFLSALCEHPLCEEVVVLPRIMPDGEARILSKKLTYLTHGLNGKLKYFLALAGLLRKDRRFDLILCGHLHLLILAYWVKRFFIRVPLLLVLYGVDAWKPKLKYFSKHLVHKIDGFISISEVTTSRFLSWSRLENVKSFLLPPCVHFADLESSGSSISARLVERYGIEDRKVLLSLCRLSSEDRYKGVDEVIELMPEILKEVPSAVYVVAGEGDDRERLEKKANVLGLKDRVIFMGYVPESEKAELYRAADVFVMPGKGEGFGIVYLEAMACGIPVVASKTDGGAEALRQGTWGVLVDPEDSVDIKEGILKALKLPKGVVPEGLDYFSYSNFKKRIDSIMECLNQKDLHVYA
jgi:phosphatidyl-myo-inositol dimannoside synthase